MTTGSAPIPIHPMPLQDWPPHLRELLAVAVREQGDEPLTGQPYLHSVATLAHHPRLAVAFGQLVGVLTAGDLSARHREMVILRTAYLSRSSYEWSHHCPLAKRAGLSDADIDRIGSHDAQGWAQPDRALLAAVDELHNLATISDVTGQQLTTHFQPGQLLELVHLTGVYRTAAAMLHSCQVPLEDGVAAVPLPPAGSYIGEPPHGSDGHQRMSSTH